KGFVPGFKRIEPSFKLLEELKGKYKLALLTNAKIGLWDEWKEGNLGKYFKVVVDSSEVHLLKPDKRIFMILLDRLVLKPEECLYIDDTKDYVGAAEKLGFKTIHFKEPKESVKLIRKILYGKI
ncbi:MAG: HAD-IA family hydrolase, partial [Patescibacteria group bacterium]